MKLGALYIHPVKSCRGIKLTRSEVQSEGLLWDRRAVILDQNGKFVSQREYGKMAQIVTSLEDNALHLSFEGQTHVVKPSINRVNGQVWRDQVDLALAAGSLNEALSTFLGEPVQLALMDEQSLRKTNSKWAESRVSLADGYPILVANTASLRALSEVANLPLAMEQFRPNIVIDTETAWDEDHWQSLQIGDVILDLVKPCSRCVMTTYHPITGKPDYPETMAAMIKSRISGDDRVKGVLFGWNAVVRQTGKIETGMDVKILDRKPAWPIA